MTVAPALDVHHLAVKVRDLRRAETFYAEVLGLPITHRHVDAEGAPRSLWLALGTDRFLAVERAVDDAPTRADDAPGWHCVALAITPDAREVWRERLASHGHPVFHETPYTLYVRDPEGAVVALSHHPHPAPASRRGAGIAAALAMLAALALCGVADAQPSARRAADVWIIGSSSVLGPFGRVVEEHLEAEGLRVRRHSERSTGFARPDFFDWQREVERLRDGFSGARGVVVMIGGNDTGALRLTREESPDRGAASWISWRDEARWRELYASRVRRMVETMCDAGVPRVLVVLPADGDREGWSERIARVQEAQAAGVRGTRCGVVLDPRGDAPVRSGDTLDGVHLSTRGARQVLTRIGPALLAALRG